MGKQRNQRRKILLLVHLYFLANIWIVSLAYIDIANYYRSTLFIICTSLLGIVCGIIGWIKLWPLIKRAKLKGNLKYSANAYFVLGTIGFLTFSCNKLNILCSNAIDCSETQILRKHIASGARSLTTHMVEIKMNDQIEFIKCEKDTWTRCEIGREIKPCIYNSPFGFDFITFEL